MKYSWFGLQDNKGANEGPFCKAIACRHILTNFLQEIATENSSLLPGADLVGVFNFLRGGGVLIHTFFSFFPSFSGHFQLSHEKEKKATITKQEKITAHLVAGEEVPGLGFHLSSLCPQLPPACPHPQGKEGGSSSSR